MENERTLSSKDVAFVDILDLRRQAERAQPQGDEQPAEPLAYRVKLGREPIWLDPIEYRILAFLAARPYRAYSKKSIADAVSTERYPLREEMLDEYVASLRKQLGFFRDYVQSVPYIGYRFKA